MKLAKQVEGPVLQPAREPRFLMHPPAIRALAALMNITEVRVKLLENQPDKLRGFASITIDDFVEGTRAFVDLNGVTSAQTDGRASRSVQVRKFPMRAAGTI